MSERIYRDVEPSGTLETACGRFLADLGDWIRDCMRDYASLTPAEAQRQNNHDQGTFTLGWLPYIRATGDTEATAWMKALRDAVAGHCRQVGLWRHGYWTRQEAHHGTEHFELFLGALYRLDGDDAETRRQILDAAEHIGNWVEGLPAWFDWDSGLFRGFWLGTERVNDPPSPHNRPEHLRFVSIAMLAHAITGERRYLDVAVRHAGVWADAILAGGLPPLKLYNPPGAWQGQAADATFDGHVGQASVGTDPVARAENFLASDGIEALGMLAEATGEARFRKAAARLVDIVATQIGDPDADAAVDALRRYRRRFGDTTYDARVLDVAGALPREPVRTLCIEPRVDRPRKPSGIGKRQDMPAWFEDGRPRRRGTALLALAAEIADDADLARTAVDLARTYFALARAVYPHGRHHGCSSRSVSAIARGHGRSNNAGAVTAVLAPVLESFGIP